MSLIEQIEIVRGPSSALYGSNGVFATINIITRTPQASAPASTAMEMGSFGEQKASFSTAFAVGKHGSAILSGSAFRTHGRDVPLSSPHEELPPARNLGNERGFHTFANLVWKDWRLTAMLGTRRVAASHGWYGATIGDTGTTDLESRNYLEAAWSRRSGDRGEWNWRTYYDQFRYDGRYRYDGDDPYTNFDGAFGDWVGSDLTYRYEWNRLGALTVGAELKHEIRNTQYSYDVGDGSNASSAIRNLREHPDSAHAFLVQHELALSPKWTLYAGGRLDDSRRNSAYFSPRIALVTDRGHSTYKFMYGRAFRNPSTFERYWEPNPDLIAEAMNTLEFVAEHRMGKRTSLTGSVYHYRLASLIEGVPVSDTTLQYRNTAGAAATGAEVEVSTSVADWLQTTSAFTIQRIRRTGSHALFPNSPVPLALLRGAVPLRKVRLTMTAAVRYVGSRTDAYGGQVPSTLFADGTFTTNRSRGGVEMQFGVRNMLNRRYSDPLSPEHTPHMLPGTGRTWFVRLCWARE
jgi:iron complex outermembrane receptor protein